MASHSVPIGIIPVLPVPFFETGAVDEESFRRVIDRAIGDGVHGLAIFGLASEYAKVSDREKERLTSVLLERASDRVPVIVSITHHSLEVAVEQATHAARLGVNALMVLPPFFMSPSIAAVQAHVAAVANATDLPLIIQFAPTQTSSDLSPASPW